MKYSFVVAMYNAEKYIEECLVSMLNQTFDDFEIIIVNDGSTDQSYDLIKKYETNEKIRIINQENQGCGAARNTAIKVARGDYILIVDADDLVEPELLENISKYSTDIIKYKVRCIEDKPNNRFELINFDCKTGLEAVITFCETRNIWATPWGSAIKKDIYLKNNFFFENKRYHEDFGLMPKLYLKANTVASIDYVGYNYIKRPNSMTTTTDEISELKRTRDFMYHFARNKEYIYNNCIIPIWTKDIIVEYLTERFLLKLAKSSELTQNIIIGDINNENTTSNNASFRK